MSLAQDAADDAAAAVQPALCGFTADVYRALAQAGPGNVVCSPYSIAVALAMTVQGARGDTAREILNVLHSSAGSETGPESRPETADAAALAAGLNAVDQALASRATSTQDADGRPVSVELSTANSLWGQHDTPWQAPFLDVLARDFGAGMRSADFRHAPEAARVAINDWVSQQTRSRIPELLADDVLHTLTRLVLVAAIYLKAPWLSPFPVASTQRHPFTGLDSRPITVDLMQQVHDRAGYASGPGWVAVDLPYWGGQLAMAVVVPDLGRFDQIEQAVDGGWLAGLLSAFRRRRVRVGLPRWTTRSQVRLESTLAALGMPTAFSDAADFGAMTAQERLVIDAIAHECFVAVDEHGTEAAAATAVTMMAVSFTPEPPPSVIADRPYLYVIHDVPTHTPLFVGRVTQPAATG